MISACHLVYKLGKSAGDLSYTTLRFARMQVRRSRIINSAGANLAAPRTRAVARAALTAGGQVHNSIANIEICMTLYVCLPR
jgi:hypothetical protein